LLLTFSSSFFGELIEVFLVEIEFEFESSFPPSKIFDMFNLLLFMKIFGIVNSINILFNVISTSTNSGENSFGLIGILEILIIFSMSYIFEYGYEIQKDSKGKIYNK
jgi:hypothetical protein